MTTHTPTPAHPGRTQDHAQAIRTIVGTMHDWEEFVYQMGTDEPAVIGMLAKIEYHVAALAAEHAALLAYARALERQGVANGTITRLRATHGITDATLSDAPGPRPGGGETGGR